MRLKKTIAAGLAAIGLAAAGSASAEGGYGALSALDWEASFGGPGEISATGLRATGGYMFNDLFGIEAHVGVGGSEKLEFLTTEGAQEAKFELNKLLGLFIKPNLPLPVPMVEANVYGLLGFAYGKIDVLAETTTATIAENSFSWGAGADVALIPDRLYLTADYVDYISRTGIKGKAISAGFRLSFSGN